MVVEVPEAAIRLLSVSNQQQNYPPIAERIVDYSHVPDFEAKEIRLRLDLLNIKPADVVAELFQRAPDNLCVRACLRRVTASV